MTDTNAYSKKKQPEQVRRAILDNGAKIAIETGLSTVTIQSVAEACGLTKGGVFHHFPKKEALVDAIFVDYLDQYEHELESKVSKDTKKFGRYTLSYIESLTSEKFGIGSEFEAFCLAFSSENKYFEMFSRRMIEIAQRHKATDSSYDLYVVRLAVDGAWMYFSGKTSKSPELKKLIKHLIAMVQEAEKK